MANEMCRNIVRRFKHGVHEPKLQANPVVKRSHIPMKPCFTAMNMEAMRRCERGRLTACQLENGLPGLATGGDSASDRLLKAFALLVAQLPDFG